MTHMHITAWLLTIVLFLVVIYTKNSIFHQITRVGYILIIISGAIMLFDISSISFMYIVKLLLGLWVIAAMEMILIKGKKGKSTKGLWIQFGIAFVLTGLIGLSLPLGFDLF